MRRPQFRLRSLLIAVAVASVVLSIEINLAHFAKCVVSELGDGMDYIRGEAITTWLILQTPIVLVGILVNSIRKLHRRGDSDFAPTLPRPPIASDRPVCKD